MMEWITPLRRPNESLIYSQGLSGSGKDVKFSLVACLVLVQDFMADSEPLEQNGGPYEKGHRWAEPSIPEAANAMRWVFNHPEEARLLGEHAAYQRSALSRLEECGSRMLDRLNQIRSERSRR